MKTPDPAEQIVGIIIPNKIDKLKTIYPTKNEKLFESIDGKITKTIDRITTVSRGRDFSDSK